MRITVEVKTGANKDEVLQGEEGRYIVLVKEQRKKGKANAAVLKLLRRHFGGQAQIVRGMTSTIKLIEIDEQANTRETG